MPSLTWSIADSPNTSLCLFLDPFATFSPHDSQNDSYVNRIMPVHYYSQCCPQQLPISLRVKARGLQCCSILAFPLSSCDLTYPSPSSCCSHPGLQEQTSHPPRPLQGLFPLLRKHSPDIHFSPSSLHFLKCLLVSSSLISLLKSFSPSHWHSLFSF